MLNNISILIICFFVLSCASAPKTYPPLEEAIANLNAYKNNLESEGNTSVAIYQADEYLNKATSALQNNNLETTDHFIYLANKKLEIENELALKNAHEQELGKLKQQYNEMLSHSKRLETRRAREEILKSEKRIEQLETLLGKFQAEETSRGTLLVINDLLFSTGGAKLESQSQNRLEPLVKYLQTNTKKEIIVEGHTDSMGDASHNKHLSLQRANAVKQYLVTRGIEATRIETRGFGEEVPVSSNTTNAGRKLNRRVEVVIKSSKLVEY